ELNARPNVTPYKQHGWIKPAQIRTDLKRLGPALISCARDSAIPHSGSMPAARMTLPHFALCSVMKAANSAGVFHCATMPRALNRSAVSGRLKSAANAALSVSMRCAGAGEKALPAAGVVAGHRFGKSRHAG